MPPYSLEQINCSLLEAIQCWKGRKTLNIHRIITLSDLEGVTYNALNHIMKIPGFPHWKEVDVSSNIWERGPLACATDPCGFLIQKESFFAHIVLPELEVLERLRNEPPRNFHNLINFTNEQSLSFLVEYHYGRSEGDRDFILAPMSTNIGLDEEDPDWIPLPSVIPPLDLNRKPDGS